MSEPFIRVYCADMRGDPKIAALNADERLALIHAWDIAKNGPGEPSELRRADGATLTESELRRMADVAPERTRKLFTRWLEIGLATTDPRDGCITFPTLVRRQGIDKGNAARQARLRGRRNGPSNGPGNGGVTPPVTPPVTPDFVGPEGESNARVTGQSTEDRREEQLATLADVSSLRSDTVERHARPINGTAQVWTAYQQHHPQAVLTDKRRRLIGARFKEGFTPERLVAAIEGNHRDPHCNGENDRGSTYHAFELILRDAAHVERYEAVPFERVAPRTARRYGRGSTVREAFDDAQKEARREAERGESGVVSAVGVLPSAGLGAGEPRVVGS